MLIGAHVSIRGGIANSIDNALAIGADVFQTHPTSALMWRPLRLEAEILDRYASMYAASGLRGHWLHAVYLINLASPKPELLHNSISSLVHYMELAAALDADGVVFHPGSHLGTGFEATLPQIGAALREVIDRSPPSRAKLVVENSAGSGACVGCNFEELGQMLEIGDSARLGVCLDTQHAFASGYDMRTPETVSRLLKEFERCIGFERLALIHANDSRRPLGSNVDRHANIGEGEIGVDAFRHLLSDEHLRAVPWILEVPGQDRSGPDLAQINLLRECAGLPATSGRALASV